MKVIRYVVFYSKSVYDSKNTSWSLMPDDDIQGIVVFYDGIYEDGADRFHYRTIFHGRDSYISDGDQLFAQNDDSKALNEERYPDCITKLGKWVNKNIWDKLYKEMWNRKMRAGE